jgi:hypothetical protein
MKSIFRTFAIRLTIFSAILGAIATILHFSLPEGLLSPTLPFVIIYFYLITLAVHYFMVRSTRHSPRKFVSYFMLTTFLKFFIYVITVFVYAYFNREDLLPFVISFFVLYIFFTVFEVVSIIDKTT